MKTISPALEGFLRGLGIAILLAVLSFIANATNLGFLNNAPMAALVAGVALWAEKALSPAGTALFGRFKTN